MAGGTTTVNSQDNCSNFHENAMNSGEIVEAQARDRRIGEILRAANLLNEAQVNQILEQQRQRSGLFGDIAVSMGLLKREDVIWAISQQFAFPYANRQIGVPRNEELVMANAPFSDEVECFRTLRGDLSMGVLAGTHGDRSALAIVSPSIGDGKTYVLANLAVAFTQARQRTIIVDADMRSPRMHEIFGIDNSIGLSNILSGRAETRVIQPVGYLNDLYMLPAGSPPPNPTELVHQPAFSMLIFELTQKFDVVLVDTPAAAHGSDASVIAKACGAVLVVARKDNSSTSGLRQLLGRLGRMGVTSAGVMMNDA